MPSTVSGNIIMATSELLNELTPQQRLAISRRALVRQLRGDGVEPATARADADASSDPRDGSANGPNLFADLLQRTSYTAVARNLTERWWSRHPVNAAVQLARPILDTCARDQPVKLMAASAAAGALLVLLKPWKLLSITAMLAAVFKTSDVADLVTTLMQSRENSKR